MMAMAQGVFKQKWSTHSWFSGFLWILGAAILFFITGRLSLQLMFKPEGIATIWPASGIFLSAVLLTRKNLRPYLILTLFFTDLLVEMLAGTEFRISLVYAFALAFDAFLSAWLLIRFIGDPFVLEKVRHVFGFIGLSVIFSNAVASGIAALAPFLFLGESFWNAFRWWWSSDGVGNLLITPFILSWASMTRIRLKEAKAKRIAEAAILFISMILIDYFVFKGLSENIYLSWVLNYLTFPFLIWAALRFGIRGMATASIILAANILYFTLSQEIPAFNFGSQPYSVIVVQSYLAIISFSFLFLASLVTERRQATEALVKSRKVLQNIMDYSPSLIYLVDLEGKFLLANRKLSEILKVTPEKLIGNTRQIVLPPEIEAQHRNNDLNVIRSRQPMTFEEENLETDGKHTYLTVKFPLTDQEGNFYAIGGISSDITERKITEEALKESDQVKGDLLDKYNETQEMAQTGNWDWNLLTGEVWWSDGTYHIFELNPKEYIPGFETNATYIHPDDLDNYYEVFNHCLKTGDRLNHDFKLRTGSGKIKNCNVMGKLIYGENNKPLRFIGSIMDISLRKEIENALLQKNEELIKARDLAEESDRLKTAFLANMSHEIRTPMNAIVGFASMLSEKRITEAERQRYSEIIQSRSDDLMHLINDILELSRIESGNTTVVKEPVSLNHLIEEIIAVFRQRIERSKKTHLSLSSDTCLNDALAVMDTDAYIIRQVISNLIDNAIKYTESGSVLVGYHPPSGGSITFFVNDTGIGISPENQKIIFEHFRQAEISNPHKYGGTGLGLSICQGYMAMLESEIRVKSEPGKGSTFYFSLPFDFSESGDQIQFLPKEIPPGGQWHPVSPVYHWPGKKILLVEDEETNMEFLQIILGHTQAELVFAFNGNKVKSLFGKLGSFDLILLDVRLPDASGWDLAREIKTFYPDLPVIAQTAYAMPEDKIKSVQAGCDDYISKPIRKEILLKLLSKFLDWKSEI